MMSVLTQKKYWTDAELLAFPNDGYEREIVNGELIVIPAGCDHGAFIMRIAGPLSVHVSSTASGEVLDGQTGCRMKDGDVFSPDISFVKKNVGSKTAKLANPFLPAAPILWSKCSRPAIPWV